MTDREWFVVGEFLVALALFGYLYMANRNPW